MNGGLFHPLHIYMVMSLNAYVLIIGPTVLLMCYFTSFIFCNGNS